MFIRHLLVAVLIAASLVATSTMTSASAQTINELPRNNSSAQQKIIEDIIREEFPENAAPRMIAIAQCESGGTHVQSNGQIFRNPSGAFVGALQVDHRVHQPEINRLLQKEGRDVLGNVREYIRFTHYLYEYHRRRRMTGYEPWPGCGRRTGALPARPQPRRRQSDIVVAEAR